MWTIRKRESSHAAVEYDRRETLSQALINNDTEKSRYLFVTKSRWINIGCAQLAYQFV